MSVPAYPAYQESGVGWLGEVPAHWTLRRLGYYLAERREKVSDRDFPALSVTKRGIVPQLETAAKTDDGDNRKRVCTSDFVINGRSDRKGSSGLSALDGSVSLISIVLYPHQAIEMEFVGHLLKSPLFQEEFYRYGKGIVADLWSTNFSEMRNILLAVPPTAEQSAIAAFLDRETGKIDALVAEQERLIALLKEKRQAVISQAVTKGLDPNVPMKDSGVAWLGQVPAHWTVCALNYRYEVALGKMLDEKRITGDFLGPYIRNVHVQWGRIDTDDLPLMDFSGSDLVRYALKKGDLLVCEGGEVGRAAVWEGAVEPCFYQKALHRLRPRRPDGDVPRHVFYILRTAAELGIFEGSEGKATIAHLTAETLQRYLFPFPPLAEQVAIVEFLDCEVGKLDTLTIQSNRATALLRERRAALISAAVTGKIDVRGVVPEAQEAA